MMRYEHEDDDEDEEEDEGDDDEDEHDDDDEDEDDDDDDEDDGDDEEDEDEDADVLVLMQTEAPSKLSSALLPVCEVPSGQPPLRSDRRPTSCHPDLEQPSDQGSLRKHDSARARGPTAETS